MPENKKTREKVEPAKEIKPCIFLKKTGSKLLVHEADAINSNITFEEAIDIAAYGRSILEKSCLKDKYQDNQLTKQLEIREGTEIPHAGCVPPYIQVVKVASDLKWQMECIYNKKEEFFEKHPELKGLRDFFLEKELLVRKVSNNRMQPVYVCLKASSLINSF